MLPGAAMTAATMGGGAPGLSGGVGPVDMSNTSGLGDDYSRKMFQGITFGKGSAKGETAQTMQWGLLVLGAIVALKIVKG